MTPLRLAAFAAIVFAAGVALGQQTAPRDYRGFRQELLARIDLEGEIDGVADRDLRLSRATIAPGGHVGLHSHRGDPTIVYVLEGVLRNHHDDGSVRDYRAGEVFAESGAGSHWIENGGPDPVRFLAANIHKRN